MQGWEKLISNFGWPFGRSYHQQLLIFLPKFREPQNTSNAMDNTFRISQWLKKVRLHLLWNVICHNKERALCGYLKEIQISCILPTYFGIKKMVYLKLWGLQSSWCQYQWPFSCSQHLVLKQREIQPVNHIKYYSFSTLLLPCYTLGGIYLHKNLMPITLCYTWKCWNTHLHIFPNFIKHL